MIQMLIYLTSTVSILPAKQNMTFGCYSHITNNCLVLDCIGQWWLMTQSSILTYVMEVCSWPWQMISTWYFWVLLIFDDMMMIWWGPTRCAGFNSAAGGYYSLQNQVRYVDTEYCGDIPCGQQQKFWLAYAFLTCWSGLSCTGLTTF